MIIKVLTGGSTFHGIDYNEEKVKIGKAERLSLDNFNDYSEYDKSNIKEELNSHSVLKNNRKDFKNKQFHVALSVEGKSKTKDELLNIGRDYLEYMGYGSNPAAIYFHSDTNNNHIHIVSSRVDTFGKRIDSSYERLRGLKFIKEHLGIDYSINQQTKLEDLHKLSYSTAGQILSIGKQLGFDISNSIDNDILKIYYQGQFVNETNVKDFSIVPDLKKNEEKRVKQIRALIYKYQKTIPFIYLSDYLHRKFGLQLVFNKTRNYSFELKKDSIELKNYSGINNSIVVPKHLKGEVLELDNVNRLYDLRDNGSKELKDFIKLNISQLEPRLTGYNIIDTLNNNVYKGSDVVKLKQIQTHELKEPFNKQIISYLSSKDFDTLKSYLDLNNASFTSDFDISYQNRVIELDQNVKSKLIYDKIDQLEKGYNVMDPDLAKQLENVLTNADINRHDFLQANQMCIISNTEGRQVLIDEKDKSIHELDSVHSESILKNIEGYLNSAFNLSAALFAWSQGGFENDLNDHSKRKNKKKRLKL